jgi:hypothetical protein
MEVNFSKKIGLPLSDGESMRTKQGALQIRHLCCILAFAEAGSMSHAGMPRPDLIGSSAPRAGDHSQKLSVAWT